MCIIVKWIQYYRKENSIVYIITANIVGFIVNHKLWNVVYDLYDCKWKDYIVEFSKILES